MVKNRKNMLSKQIQLPILLFPFAFFNFIDISLTVFILILPKFKKQIDFHLFIYIGSYLPKYICRLISYILFLRLSLSSTHWPQNDEVFIYMFKIYCVNITLKKNICANILAGLVLMCKVH